MLFKQLFSKDSKENKQDAKQNENKQDEQKGSELIIEESSRPKSVIIEKKNQLDTMLNTKNAKGKTVLHKAAAKNNVGLIKNLLKEKGLEVNALNDAGFSALHVAAMRNSTESLVELMTKANVNLQTKIGETPLHKAVQADQLDNVKALLKSCKTDLTTYKVMEQTASIDEGLCTVLHYTCYVDLNPEMVNTIFTANPQLLNVPNQINKTPLHSLFLNRKIGLVAQTHFEEMLTIATLTLKTSSNQSYLHCAAQNSQNMPLAFFVSLLKKVGTLKGEFEVVHPLVNDVDSLGNTALYYLIENKQSEHAMALLTLNPNPNIWKGKSPLHTAIQNNMTDVVFRLLELGADPNVEDQNGKTPLECAAQVGNVEIIVALANKKADFTKKQDVIVKAALLSKRDNKADILTKLIGFGASPDVRVPRRQDSSLSKVSSFSSSISSISRISYEDSTGILEPGDTPLHYAIKVDDEKLAQVCLKKMPELVNRANDESQTPAFVAIKFLSPKLANLLFKSGAKLQYSVSAPAKSSSSLFSSDRQNTYFMVGAIRGFESEQQLKDFFENDDYVLSKNQLAIREKFLDKLNTRLPEKVFGKTKTFISGSTSVANKRHTVAISASTMELTVPEDKQNSM